jgi:HNH endonuclease
MMASRSELRLHLFNAYAAQLTTMGRVFAEFPKVEDTFLCPFCQQTFERDALDEPPRLTAEHCIPESVGGTLDTATLICKRCNNGMGASIDTHLTQKHSADEFLAGLSKKAKRMWMEVGEGRARAELKVTGKKGEQPKLSVLFDRNRSKPVKFDALVSALDEGMKNPEGFKWKFDIDIRYSPRRYRVALLRIGFLMMFRQFGYPYVLDNNVAQVREQLLHPDCDIIPEPVAITLPGEPPCVNVVGIIHKPAHLQSFAAIVRLKSESRVMHKAILMPGLGDGPDIYTAGNAEHQSATPVQMTLTTFRHDLEYISDPRFVTLHDELWQGFQSRAAG